MSRDGRPGGNPDVSIVVPAFNEGAAVRSAFERIRDVMQGNARSLTFEVIFVDDGSNDDTFAEIRSLAKNDSRVSGLRLAQNVGSHMAIRAGFDVARGVHACFLPCDLQDPPEILPRMYERCTSPTQAVFAVRETRDDGLGARLMAALFYRMARRASDTPLPRGGFSMALLGPKALARLRATRERNVTIEGLLLNIARPYAVISYERRARAQGRSKWTMGKKLKLFADFFVAFSYSPIRLISYLGLLAASGGFVYAGVVIANRVFFRNVVPGWSALMVVLLVMGGTQMIMTGVMGEYIWRTLDEVRSRPRYIVDESVNLEPEAVDAER